MAETFTIADIALYAYTHRAERGGFDLDRYPAIGRWLQRIADQEGHVLPNRTEVTQQPSSSYPT